MSLSQLVIFIIIGAVMLVGYLAYITKTSGNKKVKSSDTLDLERIEKAKELEKLQVTEPKKISEQLNKSMLFKKAIEHRQELRGVSPKSHRAEEYPKQEDIFNEYVMSDEDVPPPPSVALPVEPELEFEPETIPIPSTEPISITDSQEIPFPEENRDEKTIEQKVEEISHNIGNELTSFHRKNNYEKYPEESEKIIKIFENLLEDIVDDSLKVY